MAVTGTSYAVACCLTVMLAYLELIFRDDFVDPMMFNETPKAILDDWKR